MNKDLIDIIFKEEKMYKHCMFCGDIYDTNWQTKIYKNGKQPLDYALFGDYQISTGICKSQNCLEKVEDYMKK